MTLEGGFLTETEIYEGALGTGQRTGGSPLSYEAHNVTLRAFSTLMAAMRREGSSELSLGRYNTLRFLFLSKDRRLLMSDLGDHLEVSAAVVTRLVEALEEDGLVRREQHDVDRRKTWAALTEAGVARFRAEWPAMARLIEELWQGLMDEEKRLLVHLLTKLRLNLLSREPLSHIEGVGAAADSTA
jgi:DNA-binding MarR family transcriptional regulator